MPPWSMLPYRGLVVPFLLFVIFDSFFNFGSIPVGGPWAKIEVSQGSNEEPKSCQKLDSGNAGSRHAGTVKGMAGKVGE